MENKIDCNYLLPQELEKILNVKGGFEVFNEGVDSEEIYLKFYSIKEINDYNIDYQVEEFLPGYVLIGKYDSEAMVYDKDMHYYSVPFVGMFEEDLINIDEDVKKVLKEITLKD